MLLPKRRLVQPKPAAAAASASRCDASSPPLTPSCTLTPAALPAARGAAAAAALLHSAAAAATGAGRRLYVPGPGATDLWGGGDQPGPTLSAAERPAVRANSGCCRRARGELARLDAAAAAAPKAGADKGRLLLLLVP